MPKINQPKPQPVPEAIIADVQAMPIEEAEKVVSMNKAKGKRRNIFDRDDEVITETAASKVQLVSETRQRLSEAKDAYDAGGTHEAEGQIALDKAARNLVTGRVTGVLSADEVTEIIGGIFGFKQKKDGSPSKTPEGAGNTVRQRIVRMTNAYGFAEDGTSEDAFFAPVSEDAKEAVDNVVKLFEKGPDDGGITIWTAYTNLADIKRDNVTRVDFYLDPKRIAGLAEKLSNNIETAAKSLASDKALRSAYRHLWKMLGVVAEEAAEYEEEAA